MREDVYRLGPCPAEEEPDNDRRAQEQCAAFVGAIRANGRASSPGTGANGSYVARALTRRPCGYSYFTHLRCPGRHHEYPVGRDGLNSHSSG